MVLQVIVDDQNEISDLINGAKAAGIQVDVTEGIHTQVSFFGQSLNIDKLHAVAKARDLNISLYLEEKGYSSMEDLLAEHGMEPYKEPESYEDPVLKMDFINEIGFIRGGRAFFDPSEFNVLKMLVENHGNVVKYGDMNKKLGIKISKLDAYGDSLRQKLELDPFDPKMIMEIEGVGISYTPLQRPE